MDALAHRAVAVKVDGASKLSVIFEDFQNPKAGLKVGKSVIEKTQQDLNIAKAPAHVRTAVESMVKLRCFENEFIEMKEKVNLNVLGQLKATCLSLTGLDASIFADTDASAGITQDGILDAQATARELLTSADAKFLPKVEPVAKKLEAKVKAVNAWHSANPGCDKEEQFANMMQGRKGADALNAEQMEMDQALDGWSALVVAIQDDAADIALGDYAGLKTLARNAKSLSIKVLYEFAILMHIRNPDMLTANNSALKKSLKSVIDSVDLEQAAEAKPLDALYSEALAILGADKPENKSPKDDAAAAAPGDKGKGRGKRGRGGRGRGAAKIAHKVTEPEDESLSLSDDAAAGDVPSSPKTAAKRPKDTTPVSPTAVKSPPRAKRAKTNAAASPKAKASPKAEAAASPKAKVNANSGSPKANPGTRKRASATATGASEPPATRRTSTRMTSKKDVRD